jgi:hypothetical protein
VPPVDDAQPVQPVTPNSHSLWLAHSISSQTILTCAGHTPPARFRLAQTRSLDPPLHTFSEATVSDAVSNSC